MAPIREWSRESHAERNSRSRGLARMAKLIVRPVLALTSLMVAAPAWACTLCHSDTAERVRAEVFGPDFWLNAAALSAVFPVMAAAVVMVRKLTP